MRNRRVRHRLTLPALAAGLLTLALSGCQVSPGPKPSSPAPSGSSAAPGTGPTTTAPAVPPSSPPQPSLSLRQEAGQLFLVAAKADGSDLDATAAALRSGVGNAYLNGRASTGVQATAAVVSRLRAAAAESSPVPAAIASDQEGGQVQVLRGPGFSEIPSALAQGRMVPADLQTAARGWGAELRAAGLNLDLAPVLDVVPSPEFAPQNMPIGHYLRNYGFSPDAVSRSGLAFAQGLREAGVAPVVKHFPGLGRVTANTDTTADVRDAQTTRQDPYLQPFRDAVRSGARWVMLSNAYYDRIDPSRLAPFSPVVIGGMLRQDLGFQGVVMSDDLCEAKQLDGVSPGERATRFFAAGGTMLVCADSRMAVQMLDAVVARADKDPAFRATVETASRLVRETKGP